MSVASSCPGGVASTSAERVVLAGHIDTVPIAGNVPSRLDENGVLWGCGTSDMKSGLAVMLALATSVAEPAVDLSYVFYEAEEVAEEHNGLKRLFAERPDLVHGDVALLGEPTDVVTMEQGLRTLAVVEGMLDSARTGVAVSF